MLNNWLSQKLKNGGDGRWSIEATQGSIGGISQKVANFSFLKTLIVLFDGLDEQATL
jgi:hypothetical protein